MGATLRQMFDALYRPHVLYRATGVVLTGLAPQGVAQMSLFESPAKLERLTKLYQAIDQLAGTMGKHCVFAAGSAAAQNTPQHVLDRGDVPARKLTRLKGETKRQHLRIPMLLGKTAN
jgi:hypothetical protein